MTTKKENLMHNLLIEELGGKQTNLSEDIYLNLPKGLNEICNSIEGKTKRDMFFLGLLTVLGSSLRNNVTAYYNENKITPNLYTFIIAPNARGKGILNKLIVPFDNHIDGDDDKKILVSANSSGAGLLKDLERNNGFGLMFTTEADTLSNTLSQDWGNTSDILRKAYYGEKVDVSRKKDADSIKAIYPLLSLLVCGTLNQFHKLSPSVENGLFSRLMIYQPHIPAVLNVGVANKKSDLDNNTKLNELINRALENKKKIQLMYTQAQLDKLFNIYEGVYKDTEEISDDLGGVITRGACERTVRIAIILEICEYLSENESLDKFKIIKCSDKNWNNAIEIVQFLTVYSIDMFIKVSNHRNESDPISCFIKHLPENRELTISEIESLTSTTNSTCKRRMKVCKKRGLLTKMSHGKYIRET